MANRVLAIVVVFVVGLLAPINVTAQDASTGLLDDSPWPVMREIEPRSYASPRVVTPVIIDGRLDETAWQTAPWSQPYVDIEGDIRPAPRFDTRMKMIWDDEYLYVGARMEDPHLWATLTEKNSVIFKDNDFEVFVDPNGDNHNYYEFEVNAFNTIWELRLGRPYRDGGPIFDPQNMPGVISAVHLDGTLNDPSDEDAGWSVEIAFPWDGFASFGAPSLPPEDGDVWRMNFSRVAWQLDVSGAAYAKRPDTPENNWTWTAQGAIAMHMPERWGFVQFWNQARETMRTVTKNDIAIRDLLMEIYHRQKAFHGAHGEYARSLSDLSMEAQQDMRHLKLESDGEIWTASIHPNDGMQAVLPPMHVNERGRLWRPGSKK